MKTTRLNFRPWISILATLSILFIFVGQSYSETVVHVANFEGTMLTGADLIKAEQIIVTVLDQDNDPVEDLTVTGEWSKLLDGTASGVTDVDGKATFVSNATKKCGILRFTVTDISGEGYIYSYSDSTDQTE